MDQHEDQYLIVYSSTDGQTKKICSRLTEILEENNNHVDLVAVNHADEAKIVAADKIVIGASIRYGKHSKPLYDFVNRHKRLIERKPNAFFSVNVVARKPEKNSPETNPYLKKFLKQVSWEPRESAVFAGKIDYPKYGAYDRFMIRFIMWATNGPTNPQATIEFTDWEKVAEFGKVVNEM